MGHGFEVAQTSFTILTAADMSELVTPQEVMASQREAFLALSSGKAQMAPRLLLPITQASSTFCYLARLSASSPTVCKVGSVVPANLARGLPTVSAIVMVLDPITGHPLALLDGETVTNLRTVAASGVVASSLAPEAKVLAVIGWGAQGRRHAALLSHVMRAREVRVFDAHAQVVPGPGDRLHGELRVTRSARQAVNGADLVVTCTTSHEPVVKGSWLAPGALVMSLGSFAPDRQEVDEATVRMSRVVVDHRETALQQAGPIVAALKSGGLLAEQVAEIGDLLANPNPVAEQTRTFYNSVGVGIQDAAVVSLLLERAAEAGVGQRIEW